MTNFREYLVLLHGMGRSNRVMEKMSRHFAAQGYVAYNDDYRSSATSIESLTDQIAARIRVNCPDEDKPIHFVGHSLGAIIIRMLLAKYRPHNLGRVVMLAPPNQGSYLVDYLKKYRFFQKIFGPVARQLSKDEEGIIHRLPPVDYDVGIIAGDRSIDLLFSWFLLPGENDGKVTVEETKLTGMKDHIVIHAAHPFLPNNRHAQKQTAHFLQNGRFFRS
jgi:pimeloyl-ACP methyl ester carboxylesterase